MSSVTVLSLTLGSVDDVVVLVSVSEDELCEPPEELVVDVSESYDGDESEPVFGSVVTVPD